MFQNTNPYKKFGYTSNVEYKLPMDKLFRVINSDTTSEIKAMTIDFEKAIAYLLGENDALISELAIDPKELMGWITPDPKASKYPHQSPYAYCSNNPIMRIDPDGQADDWYRNSRGQTFWREGNAPSVNVGGEVYTNIGATYSMPLNTYSTVNYTQNVATSITTNVMSENNYVSQFSKPMWGNTPANQACNKACDAMLSNVGVKSVGMDIVVNNAGNGRAGNANSNAANAIAQMSANLDAGLPTKVNVDYRNGQSSADGMGDHFIVVTGRTDNISNGQTTSTSFRYFDPGRKDAVNGTSPSNSLNVVNGRLVRNQPKKETVVTSIRPSILE
jgi:hypothetical protein